MRIIVGADFVPTPENEKYFIDGNMNPVLGDELESIVKSADFSIFNLECALTRSDERIKKSGPAIFAAPEAVNGYKSLGVGVLAIANNHVFDCGYDGFVDTLNALDNAGLNRIGGGMTKEEASRGYIAEVGGKRIGVYAACEHEFSWIEDYGVGANGFDALDTLDEIVELKKQCDYLIVLYHGGKEHYPYPSPYLRRVTRKIVEKGADIVLCQHTHIIGAGEDYKGGKIIYGQGNFVFVKDRSEFPESWFYGMLVAIDITDEGVSYEYIPFETTDIGVKLSKDPSLVEGFLLRSEEIKDEVANELRFAKYADETINQRYIYRALGKRIEVDDPQFNKCARTMAHFMECEVHREMILIGVRYRLGMGKYGEVVFDENGERIMQGKKEELTEEDKSLASPF